MTLSCDCLLFTLNQRIRIHQDAIVGKVGEEHSGKGCASMETRSSPEKRTSRRPEGLAQQFVFLPVFLSPLARRTKRKRDYP